MNSPPPPPDRMSQRPRHLFKWGESWLTSLQKLRRSDQIMAVILLTVWIMILLGYFLSSRNRFDGNLLVKEMSFTYTGGRERQFLNGIESLQKLDLKGSQPQSVTLTGRFSSTDPDLNQKLKKLGGKLTFQLPYADSRLILSTIDSKSRSQLSITSLRVESDTQVNQLSFNAKRAQLFLCLQSSSIKREACLFPEKVFNQNQPFADDAPSIAKLALQLGQQPLEVTLVRFNSKVLGNEESITFKFIPAMDVSDIQLPLFTPTQVDMSLPNLNTIDRETMSQWFWGEFAVEDVRFRQIIRNPSNVADELNLSSILAGKVRMGSQTLELQPDQFFVIPPNEPGIDNLLFIRVSPKTPSGISTSFSGESTSIGVGFYDKSPAQSVKLNWVSKFPQEAINSVLAFIGALTGFLLPRLIPEPEDADADNTSISQTEKSKLK